MSLAVVYSRANIGIDAPLVTVEVHLSNGLPGFTIVGLPETAVKESKERVRSAILNSQLEFPARRITVNLAPADLPKGGGRFDLAIAVGILAANKQLEMSSIADTEILGELALSGEVRAVTGILPGIVACRSSGRKCIIPLGNAPQASLVKNVSLKVCGHLLELCAYLKKEGPLGCPQTQVIKRLVNDNNLEEVVGQYQARRALTIAAAGGHNLLMKGPPGTGKTMLANRLSSILPALSDDEALEVAAIRSISNPSFEPDEDWYTVPFRAPHHTSSPIALVGGGKTINAGEISLAHNGVLFLDELPEFSPKALEVMREPMESGLILISRASYQVRLPARFQLIAAMNPCPCGYHGDKEHECRCTDEKVNQYQQRVSGPLLDRIDLHVEVPRLGDDERRQLFTHGRQPSDNSETVKALVSKARQRQVERTGRVNAQLTQTEIKVHCELNSADEKLLESAIKRLKLSTRAHFRILKIARTIADLEEKRLIGNSHLMEAISYRKFDRQL